MGNFIDLFAGNVPFKRPISDNEITSKETYVFCFLCFYGCFQQFRRPLGLFAILSLFNSKDWINVIALTGVFVWLRAYFLMQRIIVS